MDYIREFDIRLEKEMYYAGELLSGVVILDTIENFKLRGLFGRTPVKNLYTKTDITQFFNARFPFLDTVYH